MKKIWSSLFLCCILCSFRSTEGARILGLFPLHGKSHFIMYQEVMKSLADAGHQVDVVSHFPQKKPYPNYTDLISLEGTMPIVLNNMTYEFMQANTGASLKGLVDVTGNNPCQLLELPELKKLIKSPPTNPPYDLVIVEVSLMVLDSLCHFENTKRCEIT